MILTASDAQSYDDFGISVAMEGNRLVVGASVEDTAATDAGKVYIYDWNGTSYDEVTTVTASDAQDSDGFGISVAIEGNRLVEGAYREDTAAGDGDGKVCMELCSSLTRPSAIIVLLRGLSSSTTSREPGACSDLVLPTVITHSDGDDGAGLRQGLRCFVIVAVQPQLAQRRRHEVTEQGLRLHIRQVGGVVRLTGLQGGNTELPWEVGENTTISNISRGKTI